MPQKTETVNTITTAIAEYSATAAALFELKTRLTGAKYEVTTTAGMDTAKKDRRELVTLRTDLEKKRVEIKAPALERCRLIDAEAKRITGELIALEQPIDAQIKAEEERKAAIKAEKERLEAERKSAIMERVDKIRNLPLIAVDAANALELEEFIAKVEAREIGADFAEFIVAAQTAKAEAVAKLKDMLASRREQEAEAARIKAEQDAAAAQLEALRIEQEAAAEAERERLAAEKIEQDRLNAIREEEFRREREELDRLRREDAERRRIAEEKAAAEKAEAERIAAEEQARIEAERAELQRQQDELRRQQEEAAAEAERERIAKAEAEATEAARVAQEKAHAEEMARLNAATADQATTLRSILATAQDESLTPGKKITAIIQLAKLGIERGAK